MKFFTYQKVSFHNKRVKLILSASILLSVSLFTYYLNITVLDNRGKAGGGRLEINIVNTRVDQLGSYKVSASDPIGMPVNGKMKVMFYHCALDKPLGDASCQYHEGIWSGELAFVNGWVNVNLMYYVKNGLYDYVKSGTYYHNWQQVDSAGNAFGPISNQTILHVTPVDTTQYWDLNESSFLYSGTNYKKSVTGKTQIDFIKSSTTLCGKNLINMRFTKSRYEMYWAPCYAGVCGTREGNTGSQNLSFFLDYAADSGGVAMRAPYWFSHDATNTSFTSVMNKLHNATDPIPETHFIYPDSGVDQKVAVYDVRELQTYGTNNFPYYQIPKYLDFKQYNKSYSNSRFTDGLRFHGTTSEYEEQNFCSTKASYNASQMSIIDDAYSAAYASNYHIVDVSTPAYSGAAIVVQLKEIYPDGNNQVNCTSMALLMNGGCGNVLREDWYFAKGIGLVQLDQKYFGSDGYSNTGNPTCPNDTDCRTEEMMARPDFRMQLVKKSGLVAIPTPTPQPTSTPTPKPTNTPVPTHTSTPIPTSTPTASPTNTPVSYKQYGDLNNDKRVDLIDLSILSQYWGTGNSNGDINSDGRVDIIDLSVLAANWGRTF